MKQIMKRGLKLFLILCLLVESFSTAVAVKAEETADKGRMVKIYVAGTLVETNGTIMVKKFSCQNFTNGEN